MYQVTVHHHDKNWRNGDLEDKLELVEVHNYKTKKEAKEWIESKLVNKSKKQVRRYPHTGNIPSKYFYFTGVEWQHENTGETMYEYYCYTLEKAIK